MFISFILNIIYGVRFELKLTYFIIRYGANVVKKNTVLRP